MEFVTSIAANAAHTRVCQPNLLRRLKWIVLLSVCMIGSPHLTPAYQQQRDDHVLHCSSPRVGTDIEDYFSCADLVVSVQNCSLSRKECGVWSELIGVLLMRLGGGPIVRWSSLPLMLRGMGSACFSEMTRFACARSRGAVKTGRLAAQRAI